MSAPNAFQQNAELMKYGFLADRAQASIQKVINKEALDQEDAEIMDKASAFLQDICDGAELITTGSSHSANAHDSLLAINFALDLLNRLPGIIRDNEGMPQYFSEMSEALKTNSIDSPAFENAQVFFNRLGENLSLVGEKRSGLFATNY